MRFNTFTDCWTEIEISSLIKEVNIKTSDFITYPLYSFTIEDGVTPKTDRYERSFLVKKDGELFKVIKKDYFIMNPMNLRFGAINFSKTVIPVSVSGYYDIFTIDDCNYNYFWNAYFKNNKTLYRYNQIATGSLEEKKRVYFNQFIKMKFKVPSNDEKCKINYLISFIEDRINTQKKIINLIESQINQIRKTLIKELEKQHCFILLSEIIEEYSEKTTDNNMYPVLSSTKSGIHLQSEYFNKEAASDDTTGYKIIPKGYCTYRSMSDTGEFTFNVQNLIEKGIVSPAYPVFTTKYNNDFIIEYLNNSTKLRNNILSLKEGGTRFALSLKKLTTLEIPKISIIEQNEFIDIINKINNKIKNEKQILSLYEKQKQYLLDKLFI